MENASQFGIKKFWSSSWPKLAAENASYFGIKKFESSSWPKRAEENASYFRIKKFGSSSLHDQSLLQKIQLTLEQRNSQDFILPKLAAENGILLRINIEKFGSSSWQTFSEENGTYLGMKKFGSLSYFEQSLLIKIEFALEYTKLGCSSWSNLLSHTEENAIYLGIKDKFGVNHILTIFFWGKLLQLTLEFTTAAK